MELPIAAWNFLESERDQRDMQSPGVKLSNNLFQMDSPGRDASKFLQEHYCNVYNYKMKVPYVFISNLSY